MLFSIVVGRVSQYRKIFIVAKNDLPRNCEVKCNSVNVTLCFPFRLLYKSELRQQNTYALRTCKFNSKFFPLNAQQDKTLIIYLQFLWLQSKVFVVQNAEALI
jgi:hypothetical protein